MMPPIGDANVAKFNCFLFVFFFGASIQLQFLLPGYQRFQTWPSLGYYFFGFPSVCFFRNETIPHFKLFDVSFQGGGGKYPKISKHEFSLKPRAVKRN